jgi:hypothetical protein
MEEIGASEMSVATYKTTHRHNPDDHNPNTLYSVNKYELCFATVSSHCSHSRAATACKFPFPALPVFASIIVVLETVIKRDLGVLNHLDPKYDHSDYGCSRSVSAMAMHFNALRYNSFCNHRTQSDDELSPQNTFLFWVHGAPDGTPPCLGKLLGV